jgi:hypothetical protein
MFTAYPAVADKFFDAEKSGSNYTGITSNSDFKKN